MHSGIGKKVNKQLSNSNINKHGCCLDFWKLKVMPFTHFSMDLHVTCRNNRSICSLSSNKKANENIY